MKILASILLVSQMAFAATPADWNACVQSFQASKTPRLNIASVGSAPNNKLLFRNGYHFNTEGLSIFNKGAFWYAELQSVPDFYEPKIVRANLGGDAFCLKYNFNPIFRDQYILTPFNSKCKSTSVMEFNANATFDSSAVLARKLSKDIELTQFCFSYITTKHDFNCSESQQREDFQKIKNWNTAACKKLANSDINKAIAWHEQVLREYPVRSSTGAAPSKAPPAADTVNRVN